MDALSSRDPCRAVVLVFGAQLGKTETGLNWIGSIIDVSPGPILMVQPTDQTASKIVRQRLDPAIADTPCLFNKVSRFKKRDGGNSRESKEFPGGILFITTAGSAANLASVPIRYLFLDEVDRYPGDVGGEGDPITLARARTRTFSMSKELITSTPTETNASRIYEEYLRSDQRQYHVPCPSCGEYQALTLENLVWDKTNKPGGTTHHPETAHYRCAHCQCAITEEKKTAMLAAGKWIAQAPESKFIGRQGYHLNSLYSPLGWYSWAQIASDFIDTKQKPHLLKTFVNTVLAETWQEEGEVPDWQVLYRRRRDYKFGTCPKGVLFLTAGADVQRDRIEVEIVGWGRNMHSWSIDYHVFPGDTASMTPWVNLWSLLTRRWPANGAGDDATLGLQMIAVDSGDQTQLVYTRVREIGDQRVMAVRGFDNNVVVVGQPKVMDIDFGGRKIYRGVKMWPVGSSIIKTEIYGFLRLLPSLEPSEPNPVGFCEFPQYPKEFFLQLTAERRVQRVTGAKTIFRWEKNYERNEVLDCRVYARAAAFVFGLDRLTERQWIQLEEQLAKPTKIIHNKKKRGPNPFTGGEPYEL